MDPRAWAKDLTGYFLFVLFTATLGPLLFGFHLAELNAPEDVIRCKKPVDASAAPKLPQCMPMDPAQWGLVSSIFTLGGLIGALSAGPVASKYGRLRCMHLTTIFFVIGPVFEALSPSSGVLALGRFISGIGAGASVVVVPIYISEIAPPAERGFFGAFTQITCNCGILLTQLLGYFFSHDSMWRLILAVGGVVGIVQAVGLVLGVESPKWLADQGHPSAAKKNLRKIRGSDANITEEISGWGVDNVDQMSDEEETLLHSDDRASLHSGASKDKNSRESLSMFQVLRHPDTKKATFAVMVVMVAQQFSGINTIIMYGVSLLSTLLSANSALLNLFVSAVNIVVTTGCAPLIERLGRKTCLISSIAGMGTSALLIGISIIRVIPILSAIAVVTFVASFALGLGPVPFILASELVGPEAVGATQSWALAANWIATFIVAQFFPMLKAKMGGYVFFIFTALAVGFGAFVALVVPETKGKKDADEVWGRHPARRED
ncbi:putative mfs glucose protein [Lasiodiplodia theobromae]|uniref:Putative metabolite transport protein n=1 Tax=Lasiodiplodia theobromae TaxID=45133 RepID=A0A5N5DM74_9PEZI|nr:putative metabolite transport protein [Lasiodiplodia theobromae]KAF9637803.1 putative mfs glucose protein [Lasiodiplodia theobromae]